MSNVLVYADDPAVRDRVRLSLGRRPAPDVDRLEYLDADNGPAAVKAVDAGGVDLAILDGEAWPEGGLGLSRQLKNEIRDCPMIVVLVARRDDAWLGKWSQADAVVPHSADPGELAQVCAQLLRDRASRALPVPVARKGLLGLLRGR